ncbi:hypothetical protein GOP47_0021001, partial [Adiantum capillus-veneris]
LLREVIPFPYSEAVENGTQTGSRHRSVGFCAPFRVPDYLLTKLPPSEKLHLQQSLSRNMVVNPKSFSRFLVEHPELLQPVPHNDSRPDGATNNTGETLTLLGLAYGSGDEDDNKALRAESSQGDEDQDISCGKASATTPPLPKCGEEAQPKVHEHASKPLSLLEKKKKGLVGTQELIQPNKKIVSQLMAPREHVTSSWHSVPTSEDLVYGMSADAAAAMIPAATRHARGLRQDSSINNKSPSSSGLSHKDLEANKQPATAGASKGMSLFGFGQTDMRLAKAAAEAAAIAASHEAIFADALLTLA